MKTTDSIENLKKENESLKEELYQLKSIIYNLPGSVYWKNKDGVYLGRSQYAAELMYRCGLESEVNIDAVVGKTDFDLFDRKTAEQYRRLDEEVMNTERMEIKEERMRLSDGQVVHHLSMKRPLYNQKGEVVGIIGNSVNITAQKEAEELRLKNTVNEEKIETTRMFAASIAHELRTPLISINASASSAAHYFPALLAGYKAAKDHGLLEETISENKFKLLVQLFENIKQEVSYSNLFINMLLMNIQELKIRKEDLKAGSMQDFVEQALVRFPFPEHQSNLVELNRTLDFEVELVPIFFEHMLFNLLKNSLYYIEAAGKGHIEIWLEQTKDWNILHFKDTGQGIPEDKLPHIFDQFYTDRHQGTGVGLNFCKQVMKELDGEIQCESKFGDFAHFMLMFPKIK